ncbi:MAG: hypothetical protein Kow0092_18900 [Deferrisomatales bacterium]
MREPSVLTNCWKRKGVFACSHAAHDDFLGSVSPYHVLREKRCFPRGCLYFRWRCRRLEKGRACKRKFRHVGRLCRGCREYEEDKIHQQPRLLLTPGRWLDFRRELEIFEDWVDRHLGRDVEASARVADVKPAFTKERGAGTRVRFRGFLVVLEETYLGRTRFDSPVYARVSRSQQERHAFRRGDLWEGRALVRQDRGRLVLERLRGVEVLSRGDGPVWDGAAGLVAKRTATTFSRQPERCLICPWGTLLDVREEEGHGVRHYRRLLCLEGRIAPELCPQWDAPTARLGGNR